MTTDAPHVRLKPIALPSEHGSWGFLFEPILLGLVIAPSWAGGALAVAVIAAFLFRNPARIFLRGRKRIKESPRFAVARRIALIYALISVSGVAACVALAGVWPLWPLVLAIPFVVAFIIFDSRNRGRSLAAEMLGPVGLAAATPAIVLAGGWEVAPALGAWVIVVVKALPTVFYVRTRLDLEDGKRVNRWPSNASHLVAMAVAAALARAGVTPWLTLAMLGLLAARAAIGLTSFRWGSKPKQIGILEFVFSGLYVIATAVGYYSLP